MGHDVIAVYGETTSIAPSFLNNIEKYSDPDQMLKSLISHADSDNPPDSWVHELSKYCSGKNRIGFKLESNLSYDDLIESAKNLISTYKLNGVVANLLQSIDDNSVPRAFWVDQKGAITDIKDNLSLAMIIDEQISR